MGDVEFAVLVTRLEDDAYDLGEVGCSNVREIETLGQRIDETKAAMFAHINALRAAVRAADAMAGAVDGYSVRSPDTTPILNAREKYAEARAKCGEVT